MIEQAKLEMARELGESLLDGGRGWLFLDYDGTLAEFVPTSETILPDTELIQLIERLAKQKEMIRVAILSGRKVSQIKQLLPILGILLAGTYGIEFEA